MSEPVTKNSGAAVGSPRFVLGARKDFRSVARPFFAGLAAGVSALLSSPGMTAARADVAYVDIVLPLSGAHARIGRVMQIATEQAVAASNDAASKPEIRLRFHDDKCSRAGGDAVARRLLAADPQVEIAIGFPCSTAVDGARSVFAGKQPFVVIEAGGAFPGSGKRRQTARLTYRIFGDQKQSESIARYLAKLPVSAKIGIVRDKTQFATRISQEVILALQKADRKPVAIEIVSGGDKDFAALATRLSAHAVTHVALAAFPDEAQLLVTELVRQLPAVEVVGTDTLARADFARSLGGAIDSVVIAIEARPDDFAKAAPLLKRARSEGFEANKSALAAVAAIEIWREIIATERMSRDPVAALRSRGFETIIGPLAFDANGEAELPLYRIYRWSNGDLVQITD